MFEILFITYWFLALLAMFTIYKAIEGYQTHHCVDEDDEFYDDFADPDEIEMEKWKDYHDDIKRGLTIL